MTLTTFYALIVLYQHMGNMKFYTTKEFAKLLEIHPNTVRKMIKAKRLHPVNVGTAKKPKYKIPEEDLDRLMSESFDNMEE